MICAKLESILYVKTARSKYSFAPSVIDNLNIYLKQKIYIIRIIYVESKLSGVIPIISEPDSTKFFIGLLRFP